MSEKIFNKSICLKQFITEKEFKELKKLEDLCFKQDKTNLKLELEYKLNMSRNSELGLKGINEFLYYIDDDLVAYLGISSFGGSNIGEINGMTHPDFRRKGLFKKLFDLAIDECQKRNFNKLLLLSDGNSNSGVKFINSFNGEYNFSEYRMRVQNHPASEEIDSIKLRKAEKLDGKEIGRQNALFFNHSEEHEWCPQKEEELNKFTYIVELNKTIIGKVMVTYSDKLAFISGVGILPEYRGKGYGKAALRETLRLINEKNSYEIELDVECKNSAALYIYKACGFEEVAVMNYYTYNI